MLAESIQSNFINTLWRFLQKRTATKAITKPHPLTKDGGEVSQRKVNLTSRTMVGVGWNENYFSIQARVAHTSNL